MEVSLLSKWEGPYVIEEVYRSGATKINNAEGTNPKAINGQQIKYYISGTPIVGDIPRGLTRPKV